jgi:hypothetical protein
MLAWGVVEFPQGYAASGQLPAALDSIRWAADFFMRCHVSDNIIIAQVGVLLLELRSPLDPRIRTMRAVGSSCC